MNNVRNSLVVAINDYDIKKSSTDIIPYKDSNDIRLLKEFLITKKVEGRSDSTLIRYNNCIMQFLLMARKSVEDITPKDIIFFLAYKESEGVSRVTCNNYKHIISSFFDYLLNEEIVKSNPVKKTGDYKVPKIIKSSFTDMEVETMRNYLTTFKQKAIFEILISTACRVSELINIKVPNIRNEQILITGKGNKERYLILNARAQIAISNYLNSDERNNIESEYLFPGRFGGAATVAGVEKMLKQIGDENGIHAHPHKFRRTCATKALSKGMDISYISKMLGHSNIATTQIYLDINNDDLIREHKKYIA